MKAGAVRERLVGAALRALAVAVGVTPAVVHGVAGGAGFEALAVQALIGLFAFVVLLGERRDAELGEVLTRTAIGGVVAAHLCAGVGAWVAHAGDLEATVEAFGRDAWRALGHEEGVLRLAAFVIATPLWGVLLIARAYASGVVPHALAGLATAAAVVAVRAPLACEHEPVPLDWALCVGLSGAWAGIGVAFVDRLLDVASAPRRESTATLVVAALVPYLAGLSVLTVIPVNMRGTRHCCSVSFLESCARDGLEQTRAAGGVVPRWLKGYRVARDARGWWATYDPPPGAHPLERRWWVDAEGRVRAAPCGDVPPLPLDPTLRADTLPAGWVAVAGGR